MKYCITGYLCYLLLPITTLTTAPKKLLVGYYPEWAYYFENIHNPVIRKVTPIDLPGNLLTHINYAFIKPESDGSLRFEDDEAAIGYKTNDKEKGTYFGNIKQLQDLKKRFPHLQTLISIGGWSRSTTFAGIASDAKKRKIFALNAIDLCKKYGFDGIDIDWEFPGYAAHGGTPDDTKNFTLLLQDLYQQTSVHNLLLTIAAPATIEHLRSIDLRSIEKYLNWINVMTYDFAGPWSPGETTAHSAPLFASLTNKETHAAYTINYYIKNGIPKNKIVMGLPLYGRSFAGVSGGLNGLGGTYTKPGGKTTDEGIYSFADITKRLHAPGSGYTYHWDDTAKAPYLFNATKREFISYDDERVWKEKCAYINTMDLKGAMVWDISQDTNQWQALNTIAQALNQK